MKFFYLFVFVALFISVSGDRFINDIMQHLGYAWEDVKIVVEDIGGFLEPGHLKEILNKMLKSDELNFAKKVVSPRCQWEVLSKCSSLGVDLAKQKAAAVESMGYDISKLDVVEWAIKAGVECWHGETSSC